jgi:hypothetical protein
VCNVVMEVEVVVEDEAEEFGVGSLFERMLLMVRGMSGWELR